ncbi:MAG TPA: beta-ketoacyl-ACP synthase II [Verrucomicrobiae bacterium]|nr:beta-ketoacyl-ACP synthase II [Verrucomicrobiae bacterium]
MESTNRRRVVVTGVGVVSPVGIGLEPFWKSIVGGVSGVDRSPILARSDCHWKIAGEVKDFHPEEWLGRKDAKRMDRFAQLALVASYLALQDSKLNLDNEDRHRIGVSMGTAYAGLLFGAQEYDVYKEKGIDAISPYMGIAIFTGAGGGQVSLHLGLKAPSITISTGCDCSTAAVAHAADMIQRGDVDVMFAGGADAPIHPIIVAAFGASYALSDRNSEPQRASRPFDRKRDGFVMGEGSCILVVEELERAKRRGAHIYAELVGWASTCDAHHMCHPDPSGEQAARALMLAMAQAGVRPEQIDYLNAHGTSTPAGDKAETLVVKKVFGESSYKLPVSSIKSQLGHMQGACGSAELAACCMAIQDNVLPPTINYEYPDPECDLDYIPNQARYHHVDIAASNSFSFGGRNTAVILRRHRNGADGHGLKLNGNGKGGTQVGHS